MPGKVTLFRPSRWYAVFAALSLTCAFACGWFAYLVDPAANSGGASALGITTNTAAVMWTAASALFGITLFLCLFMLLRPVIRVHAFHLEVGKQRIAWDDVVSIETSRWATPLLVRMTLANGTHFTLLHTGDAISCQRLLHLIGRNVRFATLDGIPFEEVWNGRQIPEARSAERHRDDMDDSADWADTEPDDEPLAEELFGVKGSDRQESSEREPLLSPEDAEEVERLYQRLKKVGRLDQAPGEEN